MPCEPEMLGLFRQYLDAVPARDGHIRDLEDMQKGFVEWSGVAYEFDAVDNTAMTAAINKHPYLVNAVIGGGMWKRGINKPPVSREIRSR